MNYATWVFVGVFLTFLSSWLGLVFFPDLQLKDLQAYVDETTREIHPSPISGLAQRGRDIYVAEGCTYCHSQQIRGGNYNADLQRGWGVRRSHPVDYIYDNPQLLGTMRTGPDLANIGLRQPSAEWHYLHLYAPEITSPDSIMPPYRYFFEKRKIVGEPSPEALPLEDEWAPEEGYEIVPTRDARALVAYLLSLDQSYEIPETKR